MKLSFNWPFWVNRPVSASVSVGCGKHRTLVENSAGFDFVQHGYHLHLFSFSEINIQFTYDANKKDVAKNPHNQKLVSVSFLE